MVSVSCYFYIGQGESKMSITSDNNNYKIKLYYFFIIFKYEIHKFELRRCITNEKKKSDFVAPNTKYRFRISIEFMWFLYHNFLYRFSYDISNIRRSR